MTTAIQRFHIYLYGPEQAALRASFEEASTRLQLLPRLYFELDGSFVWSAAQGEQIEGMLYDANERLQYVDLQGQCSRESWNAVLHAIVGSSASDCIVMVIPTRSLKNLPTFEQSVWGD